LNYDSNIEHDLIDNENFIVKPRRKITMRLADVNGSELARAIDPKLAAINLFAKDDKSFNGQDCIYSEKVADGNARLPNVQNGFTQKTFTNGFIVNMKLKKYISNDNFKFNKLDPKGFIEQWLLAVSLGVLDYWHENNFPCFQKKDGSFFIGRAFDFECCMHIINFEDMRRTNASLFDAKKAFEKGLTGENVEYLRSKHPETSKEFFAKLLAVDVDSICDFSKVTVHPYSDGLSERATKGYKARFKKLADQYAKLKE
jgi:hypothetical protein